MLRLMGNSVDEQHWSRTGFHCSVASQETAQLPSTLPLSPVHRPLLQDVQVSKGGILLTLRAWGHEPRLSRVLRTESGGKGQCGGRALPTCIFPSFSSSAGL